jgi:hypothetical protein
MTNKLVEATMAYYKLMFLALKSAGCRVYLTGSALVPGVEPTDLDYVVECPADFTRSQLDAIVRPYGFRDADAREGYEKDASQTVPEDHQSDLGIYQVEGSTFTLPVQLLLFVRESVAAGHWRTATATLKAHPEHYVSREARVRMFREVRGQAI